MGLEPQIRVLFVDDDEDIRAIALVALGLDPNMRVRAARDGRAALALLADATWRPDVVILDVMMPGMGGEAVFRALRDLPGLAAVPVIFLTAMVQAADTARYTAMGAAAVIAKPFDPMTLATKVRQLAAIRLTPR